MLRTERREKMIDFDQLAAVNIQKLGEDEADQWCERLFKVSAYSSQV